MMAGCPVLAAYTAPSTRIAGKKENFLQAVCYQI
jgi:hypothetical protein